MFLHSSSVWLETRWGTVNCSACTNTVACESHYLTFGAYDGVGSSSQAISRIAITQKFSLEEKLPVNTDLPTSAPPLTPTNSTLSPDTTSGPPTSTQSPDTTSEPPTSTQSPDTTSEPLTSTQSPDTTSGPLISSLSTTSGHSTYETTQSPNDCPTNQPPTAHMSSPAAALSDKIQHEVRNTPLL